MKDGKKVIVNKIQKQMDVFRNLPAEYGVVFSSFYFITEKKKELLPKNFREEELNKIISRFNVVNLSSALIRKECLEKVGMFDERFPRLQDWEFFFRVSKFFRFKFIDEPLLNVRVLKDGISSNEKLLIEGFKLFIEKYEGIIDKKSLATLYRRLGVVEYIHNGRISGTLNLMRSLRYNPFDIKSLLVLLFSFTGKDVFRRITGY